MKYFIVSFFICSVSFATESKKNMAFDSQLVEGQIYRPDLSVVTGDTVLGGMDLLRLRKDFKDKMTYEETSKLTEVKK